MTEATTRTAPADAPLAGDEQSSAHALEAAETVDGPVGPETAVDAPVPTCRPQRADARRNYDALLEAAAAVFTEEGVDAPLENVARRAGVGIGTLYRHFPQRTALVVEVYRHEVELVSDAAPVLLAEHDPDEALSLWMQRFVGYVATKRGLVTALRAQNAADEALVAYVRGRIASALGLLLDAAIAAGRIRPDVDQDDLMRAIGGVCMAADDGWQERTRRIIGLLMDGLRFGAPNPAR